MHFDILKSSSCRWVVAVVLSCLLLLGPVPTVLAAVLEEVVVTAQKREELLSDVPLAISAFSGEQLSARVYTSLEDFKGAVPNMTVNGYAGSARINIRGVGQPAWCKPMMVYILNRADALHSSLIRMPLLGWEDRPVGTLQGPQRMKAVAQFPAVFVELA